MNDIDNQNITTEKRLAGIRSQIDTLDESLLELLNRRAGLSLEVGDIKKDSSDIIFKPFREKELIAALQTKSSGPLPSEHLRAIYREILSSSRRLQSPQKVVYLGPEGTFSYFAGLEFLGHSQIYEPRKNLDLVFESVAKGEAELGVIPLENSLQGSVGQSLDLFMRFDVFIQSEMFCRISHSLLSTASGLDSIKKVYSHPQALAQCSSWISSRIPQASVIPVESTAAAANMALDDDQSAAIGHRRLAQMVEIPVLATQIEDLPDNWTRFLVIGRSLPTCANQDKTSFLFTLPDSPGALAKILNILAGEGINMKKLESRPLRAEKWKYVFFVDVECDLNASQYTTLLKTLRSNCHSLRVLGSYPAGPYLKEG